mmetsp:Transcript_10302/g.23822  ORF Transcript_10302/g.23822 Transcript_10302/m.23822 type:complete len:136 (+) Transcript_10302:370-777(+)
MYSDLKRSFENPLQHHVGPSNSLTLSTTWTIDFARTVGGECDKINCAHPNGDRSRQKIVIQMQHLQCPESRQLRRYGPREPILTEIHVDQRSERRQLGWDRPSQFAILENKDFQICETRQLLGNCPIEPIPTKVK